jgi:phosphatidylglycerophosphate synthase
MLDKTIRPFIDPPLNVAGKLLVRMGVDADMVTLTGGGMALVVFILLGFEQYYAAAIFVILNRLADGLDGAVARASVSGSTDRGAFADITLDFIFYAGAAFFFALGRPEVALGAAFLIFSFIASASTFLAYAVMTAKRGEETTRQGRKGFYHMGGLMEGTETIIVLLAICLLPDYFTWIAVLFGILCLATAIGRFMQGWRQFG